MGCANFQHHFLGDGGGGGGRGEEGVRGMESNHLASASAFVWKSITIKQIIEIVSPLLPARDFP